MNTQQSPVTSILLSPYLFKPGHPWTIKNRRWRFFVISSWGMRAEQLPMTHFKQSQTVFFLKGVFKYLTCYTWDAKLSNILIWLKQKPWSQPNIWDWSGTTTASWGWQLFTQIKRGSQVSLLLTPPLPVKALEPRLKLLKIKNKMKLLSWAGVAFFSILDHW